MPLQIVTFKWGSKYSMEHVNKLYRMLQRNLTIPWEFVLITDDVRDGDGFEPLPNLSVFPKRRLWPLWHWGRDLKGCGVRIAAFSESMRGLVGDRFAWIDLDVVITGNVDHIFSRTEDFIALATPQGPLAYQGSLVMMNTAAREGVWTTWTPFAYSLLQPAYTAMGMEAGGESDEGWMTQALGYGEATFNGGWGKREDGIYFFRKDLARGVNPLPADARMVIMNGRANDPSFADLQRRCGWLREHWR